MSLPEGRRARASLNRCVDSAALRRAGSAAVDAEPAFSLAIWRLRSPSGLPWECPQGVRRRLDQPGVWCVVCSGAWPDPVAATTKKISAVLSLLSAAAARRVRPCGCGCLVLDPPASRTAYAPARRIPVGTDGGIPAELGTCTLSLSGQIAGSAVTPRWKRVSKAFPVTVEPVRFLDPGRSSRSGRLLPGNAHVYWLQRRPTSEASSEHQDSECRYGAGRRSVPTNAREGRGSREQTSRADLQAVRTVRTRPHD